MISVYTMEGLGLIVYHLQSVDNDRQKCRVGESKAVLWLSRKEACDWLAGPAMGKGTEMVVSLLCSSHYYILSFCFVFGFGFLVLSF